MIRQPRLVALPIPFKAPQLHNWRRQLGPRQYPWFWRSRHHTHYHHEHFSPLRPVPLTDPNNKLPTLNDLRTALANLISMPFNSLKGENKCTFTGVASTFNAAPLPLPAVRTVQFCNNVDTSTLAVRWFTLLRPQHSSSSDSSLLLHWSMHSSNGTDSARFRRRSTRYANSGRTLSLLEQLPFPLSNSPTRTFSHSTLSSSMPSARAQPASLPRFSGCRLKPKTQSHGLSRTPPTFPRSYAFSLAPSVLLLRSSNSLSSSLLRACLRTLKVSSLAISPRTSRTRLPMPSVSTVRRTQRPSTRSSMTPPQP